MGKIYYLMGKSSSGKDTIFKKLMEKKELGLRNIVPYTTRPIREGERNGVEYFFTDEEGTARLEEQGKIIELRVYHTFYGDWKYFTAADEQIHLEESDYLTIGTPEAFQKTREYFGNRKVCPILIELDDGERLMRALQRERKQAEPKYEEMCRRYLADAQDFAKDKLDELGEVKSFCNEDLELCVQAIADYIQTDRGEQ